MTPTKLESLIGRAIAPRMWVWMWLSLILVIVVAYVANHMLTVLLWKVVIITVCGFLGDKIARGAEASNLRPHDLLRQARTLREEPYSEAMERIAGQLEARADAAYMRRAIIIGACVIAGALGT